MRTQKHSIERLSMTFTANGRDDHVTTFSRLFWRSPSELCVFQREEERLHANENVSTICLFLCCFNVLTIVSFKAKLRYFFFYAKQLPRIYLRGKLFRKMHNSAVSFWTVLRFRSSWWFYVVVAVFVLIFRSHKSQYNGSILLAKSGSRHCTLQRNYSAAPHETGRLILLGLWSDHSSFHYSNESLLFQWLCKKKRPTFYWTDFVSSVDRCAQFVGEFYCRLDLKPLLYISSPSRAI